MRCRQLSKKIWEMCSRLGLWPWISGAKPEPGRSPDWTAGLDTVSTGSGSDLSVFTPNVDQVATGTWTDCHQEWFRIL